MPDSGQIADNDEQIRRLLNGDFDHYDYAAGRPAEGDDTRPLPPSPEAPEGREATHDAAPPDEEADTTAPLEQNGDENDAPTLEDTAVSEPITEPVPAAPADEPPAEPEGPFDAASYTATWIGAYTQHARVPAILLGVTIALAAASFPGIALTATPLLLTALTTAGFSLRAQVTREAKRGGKTAPLDTALRALTLPWHLARGIAASLPGILASLLSFLMIAFLAALVASGGTESAIAPDGTPIVGQGGIRLSEAASIPVPTGSSASVDGIALAAAGALSWACALLAGRAVALTEPFAPMTDAGLGMTCVGRRASGGLAPAPTDHIRPALCAWGALTAVLLVVALAGHPVVWFPLPVS